MPTGNNNNNTLFGSQGDDFFYGLGGNDTIYALEGNDYIDGGDGIDTLNYLLVAENINGVLTGVTVDLADGTADKPKSVGGVITWTTDTIVSVENVRGWAGEDTLYGNSAANFLDGDRGDDYLDGRGGNDTLYGGKGNDTLLGGDGDDLLMAAIGSDIVAGGDGIDTVDYSILTGAVTTTSVTVDLENGTATESDGSVDTLTGIENANGTGGNDTLIGSSGANQLSGGNGSDILEGLEGNDTLIGGGGSDVFLFGDGWGDDTITDWSSGDSLHFEDISGLDDFSDLTVTNVGADALVTFGSDEILIVGAASQIDSGDVVIV